MKKIIPYAIAIGLFSGLINYNTDKVRVSGTSMEPLITQGQVLYGVKTTIFEDGNIVVVNYPNSNGKEVTMVKRIYGIEGDLIKIEKDCVYKNGELIKKLAYTLEDKEIVEFRLLEDEYFIMGDNPNTIWAKLNINQIRSRIERGI